MKLFSTPINLCLGALALGLSLSSSAAVVEVTTTVDENNTNSAQCSLREAVRSVLEKKDLGGCSRTGDTRVGVVDTVVLSGGETYQLDSTIFLTKLINSSVTTVRFEQEKTFDYSARDPITGVVGKLVSDRPIIVAAPNQPLFDTSQDRVGLEFNSIELRGSGTVDQGGLIRIGGDVSLTDSKATGGSARVGGAFFLEGSQSNLALTRTEVSNNFASEGGSVIAQSCFDNLTTDNPFITIVQSSIVENTSAGGDQSSTLGFCGTPIVDISNTTIANNTVADSGAVVDFVNIGEFIDGGNLVTPQLAFNYVTLVQNTNGIRYADGGLVDVDRSVLAFNDGLDCNFTGADIQERVYLLVTNTLLQGSATTRNTNSCQVFQPFVEDDEGAETPSDQSSNSFVGDETFDTYFIPGLRDYGLMLQGYLPIRETTESPVLLNSASLCSETDQRGILRSARSVRYLSPPPGYCYKGAINRANLIASPDDSVSNDDYVALTEFYEDRMDLEPAADESEQVRDQRISIERFSEAFLKGYETLMKAHYRATFLEIFDNDVPYELVSDGEQQILLFPELIALNDGQFQVDGEDNYEITTRPIGSGDFIDFDDQGNLQIDNPDTSNLRCEYNNDLAVLTAWRVDGTTSPSGEADFCEYTISLKSDPSISSTTYVSFEFINIAPRAEDKVIQTKGDEEVINIDLTDSINDDGDGPVRPTFEVTETQTDPQTGESTTVVTTQKIPEFYRSPLGVEAYIQIVKEPALGELVFYTDATYSSVSAGVDCPNANENQVETPICYPPYMQYIRDNLLSGFTDDFDYVVYDGGALTNGRVVDSQVSDVANVEITGNRNNGNLVDATSVFAGGGSLAPWYLAVLSLLAAARFRSGRQT